MKRINKIAVTVITIGLIPLITQDLYQPIKDYLIKTTLPILLSSPVMIAELIATMSVILGSVLITNEKYKWVNKIISQFEEKTTTWTNEKQYDVKKLNNEVFRKLVNISCFEYFPYFGNKFGLCISSKPIKLDVWQFFEFHSRSMTNRVKLKEFEEKFTAIDQAIPTLKIGENYLKKNYSDVYTKWIEINHELEKINKERQIFFKKVSAKIIKNLKKEFKSEPKSLLSPHGNDWAYFDDLVLTVLPLLFRNYSTVKFDVDGIENQSYLCYGGLGLVGFNKLPEHAVETVRFIFNNVISDQELHTESGDFYVRSYNLNEIIYDFSKEIQSKVVNDIDNLI